MDKNVTFEEIEAHISKANLDAFKQGGSKHFSAASVSANPGDVLTKVCGIYQIIKPVLQGILLIPFIPSKWKDAVRTFVSLMDTLCSQ